MDRIVGQVARGLGRLPDRLKKQPFLVAFVTVILKEVQECSDAFYDLWFYRQLDNAFGDALDQWGDKIHLPRNGLGDGQYKIRLKVQLLVLRSSGTIPELLQIFNTLAPLPRTVDFTPKWPAAQEIFIHGASPDGDELSDILQSAAAGGVKSTLRWSRAEDVDTFCCLHGAGKGLTLVGNPPGSGGKLSRAKAA